MVYSSKSIYSRKLKKVKEAYQNKHMDIAFYYIKDIFNNHFDYIDNFYMELSKFNYDKNILILISKLQEIENVNFNFVINSLYMIYSSCYLPSEDYEEEDDYTASFEFERIFYFYNNIMNKVNDISLKYLVDIALIVLSHDNSSNVISNYVSLGKLNQKELLNVSDSFYLNKSASLYPFFLHYFPEIPLDNYNSKILLSDNPKLLYKYACEVENAPIEKLIDRVIEIKSCKYIHLFSRDFCKCLDKLTDAIIKYGTALDIYNFSLDVRNVDINKITDKLIQVGDVEFLIKYITNVRGVNIDKVLNIIDHSIIIGTCNYSILIALRSDKLAISQKVVLLFQMDSKSIIKFLKNNKYLNEYFKEIFNTKYILLLRLYFLNDLTIDDFFYFVNHLEDEYKTDLLSFSSVTNMINNSIQLIDNDCDDYFKIYKVRRQISCIINQLSIDNNDYKNIMELCYKKTNILLANYIIENNDSDDFDISIKIKSKF